MEFQGEKASKKTKTPISSIIFYCSAIIIALIAIVLVISNINLFNKTVTQYVAQGYARATVMKQLIQSQLLPGILDPVAAYGGLAVVLIAAGIINSKISSGLKLLAKDTVVEADVVDEADDEQTEASKNTEETK